MNKGELIEKIANDTKISKVQAGNALSQLSEQHRIGEEFNVVKFRTDAPRLSFLHYPSFFEEAHPSPQEAIAIDLNSGRSDVKWTVVHEHWSFVKPQPNTIPIP